jgi:epoxyqueuosine reductase QueG
MFGMFSNRHAAVCAGLAEFGWNGVALTPDAGPRVRWGTLITSLELEHSPMLYDGAPLCSKCGHCIEICPVGALSRTQEVSLRIEDKIISYKRLFKPLCRAAQTGLAKGSAGRLQADVGGKVETVCDWLKIVKADDKWNRLERTAAMCGRCMIGCKSGNLAGK